MTDKIYIDNSRFMELVSELATQLNEGRYGEQTYISSREVMQFTNEAQDHFNETYDEYEGLFNNIANIYSDNENSNPR